MREGLHIPVAVGARARPVPATAFRLAALPAVLFSAALAACGGAPRPGATAPGGEPCALGPQAEARAATSPAERAIVVGLDGPVDPAHAPAPRTAAERLVFAQLYETLVRVECDGRAVPALAPSWRVEADGRRWTFTLAPDVRDWEGATVTAAAVASAWTAARERDARRRSSAEATPDVAALTVIDARTLRVELTAPVAAHFFARPELAVWTPAVAGGWPTGTGPFRPAEGAPPASLPGRPLSVVTLAGAASLEARAVTGDARNALDAGVDVLVTGDPAVIGYARAGSAFATFPLAWDRSYLLVAAESRPSAGPPDPAPGVRVLRPPEAVLAALARDAVPVEARPARDGSGEPGACPAGGAPEPAGAGPAAPPRAPAVRTPRIVYPVGDAVARSLAERLVALALDPGRLDAAWLAEAAPELTTAGARATAAGLAEAPFAEALRAGSEAAYVVPVDRGAGADPCDPWSVVPALAPWTRRLETAVPGNGGPALIPLVDTRGTLVLRRGVGGVRVGAGGVLLLEGVRRAAGEGAP